MSEWWRSWTFFFLANNRLRGKPSWGRSALPDVVVLLISSFIFRPFFKEYFPIFRYIARSILLWLRNVAVRLPRRTRLSRSLCIQFSLFRYIIIGMTTEQRQALPCVLWLLCSLCSVPSPRDMSLYIRWEAGVPVRENNSKFKISSMHSRSFHSSGVKSLLFPELNNLQNVNISGKKVQ